MYTIPLLKLSPFPKILSVRVFFSRLQVTLAAGSQGGDSNLEAVSAQIFKVIFFLAPCSSRVASMDPTRGMFSSFLPRLVIRIDHTYFGAFQCLEEQFTTCTVTKIVWDDGKTDVLLSREHDNNIYKIQQTH